MIASLTGKLKIKDPTRLVIDIQGVGYALAVSLNTSQKLSVTDSTVSLFTHLQIKDDTIVLYGFIDEEERSVFLKLISISGIGPKSALAILSGLTAGQFKQAVHQGDAKPLNALPGIGKKTAARILLELKDTWPMTDELNSYELQKISSPLDEPQADMVQQAISALISLGLTKVQAEKRVGQVMRKQSVDKVEILIMNALQEQ